MTEQSPLLNLDASATMSSSAEVSHVVYSGASTSTRPPSLSLGLIINSLSAPGSSMSATVNPTNSSARVADHHPDRPVPSRGNPFHYEAPIDCYEKFKMLVMCLLGIPLLRLVLGLILAATLGVICSIATIGFTPVDPVTKKRRPLPRWRQLLSAPRPFFMRATLFVLGYHWIHVKLPEGGLPRSKIPRIVVSNHVGFIDGVFLGYYLNASIAMKAELGRIPVLGNIIKTVQPILIDRNNSEGRKRAIHDISDHLGNNVYPPLLIFPEGTTSNQNYLTKFKVGSFSSGLPCLPVALKYPFKHFDVSWTPDVSAVYLLLRMLCQVHNRLEVEFLPAYYPTNTEIQNPEFYAENVRQLIAKSLHVACTNHAFEDVALLMNIGQYADQHIVPITDVGEVSTLTALRSGDVHQLVQYFIKKDVNGDGQISLDEMVTLFPNDSPEILERLFALLDADDSGSIDFRELCIGLASINPSRDSTELMRFAFRLYDLDNNGVLDKSELDRMLAFFCSMYGGNSDENQTQVQSPVDLEAELSLDAQGQVTFESFSEFMTRHPLFLGHVKSKLQVLRGSFREATR